MPVIATDGTVPQEWWTGSLREFQAKVSQRDYPCHFGRIALARGELYATFFEDALERLADEWSYAERFWHVLQHLHDADTTDWPDGFPRHPESSAWEFSFHGVPMFVFAGAPSYLQRASRSLGPGLVLLFQPRNVFVGIEGGTPRGMAARQVIRDRLSRW